MLAQELSASHCRITDSHYLKTTLETHDFKATNKNCLSRIIYVLFCEYLSFKLKGKFRRRSTVCHIENISRLTIRHYAVLSISNEQMNQKRSKKATSETLCSSIFWG
jgi:hypothetical protein